MKELKLQNERLRVELSNALMSDKKIVEVFEKQGVSDQNGLILILVLLYQPKTFFPESRSKLTIHCFELLQNLVKEFTLQNELWFFKVWILERVLST